MTKTATFKVFDNYEISPCRRFEEPDSPGRFYFEVCEPAEADVWTLYGHMEGEGVEAIGDFASRKAAEEIYFRITGQRFTDSYEARSARLRLMHAAGELLEALEETQSLLSGCLRSAERLVQREFAARIGTMISVNRTVVARATAGDPRPE